MNLTSLHYTNFFYIVMYRPIATQRLGKHSRGSQRAQQ
jgi:hypothetical protein